MGSGSGKDGLEVEHRLAESPLPHITDSAAFDARMFAAKRLAAIVESSDDAILSKTLDGTVTSWNRSAQRLFGYEADEIIGKSIMTIIPPDRRDEERDILERVGRSEHIQHYETLRQRKDGSRVWISLSVSPLVDDAGVVVGASTITRDMTERLHADQHRKALMAELNHRVKNTMAVIQSIAAQTLWHSPSVAHAQETLNARLIHLAKTHDILTRQSWQSASLHEIVVDTIVAYAGAKDRFRVEGPDVRLAPGAALALAMALHELSTNAAKYGALSTDLDGRVHVAWQICGDGSDRTLVLQWQESGGPEVSPPRKKGFGTRLIERALSAELRGKASVVYESVGVVCTIVAPFAAGKELIGEEYGQQPSGEEGSHR